MDSRIALVTWEFFIRLLKRLRYDVFDVWLHESLKLMKRVTKCSGHNKDCRLLGDFSGTTVSLWVVTDLTVETPSDEKRSDGLDPDVYIIDLQIEHASEPRHLRRDYVPGEV
jgi:hypothetical protein